MQGRLAGPSMSVRTNVSPVEQFLQDDGFVVLLVPGAINQCDCSFGRFLFQLGDLFRAHLEFFAVTSLEFRPFGGIVSKPLSKARAWRHFLEPEIYFRLLLAQATRPQTVHKDSPPVVIVRLFVNPFDANSHRSQLASSKL